MSGIPDPRLIDSVRARLRNAAARSGEDFQRILQRYGIERFLYRLSRSTHADRFVLKGAALFLTWEGEFHRPTQDVDLLSFGSAEVAELIAIMRAIASTPVEDDGLSFPIEAIRGGPIKVGQRYEGVRLELLALLDRTRIHIQVDVGFGDTIVPPPLQGAFPTLLDLPAPQLRLYPRETVIAEKFHAVASLGMLNSRMKDFYDLWILSRSFGFEGESLCRALQATFQRRGTILPDDPPLGLTPAFAAKAQGLWLAFLKKSELLAPDFETAILPAITTFLMPAARAAGEEGGSPGRWPAGGPWQP